MGIARAKRVLSVFSPIWERTPPVFYVSSALSDHHHRPPRQKSCPAFSTLLFRHRGSPRVGGGAATSGEVFQPLGKCCNLRGSVATGLGIVATSGEVLQPPGKCCNGAREFCNRAGECCNLRGSVATGLGIVATSEECCNLRGSVATGLGIVATSGECCNLWGVLQPLGSVATSGEVLQRR